MALLGRRGLENLAKINMKRARDLAKKISEINGFNLPFKGEFFNEFVVRYPVEFEKIHETLLENGIHGGLSLKKQFPELGESALYCITETTPEWGIDKLINVLKGFEI
jgi:glycine dehydrogenase subunit 1